MAVAKIQYLTYLVLISISSYYTIRTYHLIIERRSLHVIYLACAIQSMNIRQITTNTNIRQFIKREISIKPDFSPYGGDNNLFVADGSILLPKMQ